MDRLYRIGFNLVLLTLGLDWLRSSIGKITGGKFVSTLTPTLGKFISNNPNIWYDNFTKNIVIPNSKIFGNLIMWGEFLSAVSITISSLYLLLEKKENKKIEFLLLLGLIGGAFLNFNFYFAAGWTSPSTESLNLIMFVVEAIAIVILGNRLLKK